MSDEQRKSRGGRVLRFAVSGALLIAPVTAGCGGEETHTNEPAPIRTNEPAPEPNGPVAEPSVDDRVDEPNEPAPDDLHVNEPAPETDSE